MEEHDRPAFALLMTRMAEVFQQKLSPLLQEEYWRVLVSYQIRQVTWAVEQCLIDCLFFPKPREIIAALYDEKHEGESEHLRKPLALSEHHDPAVFEQWRKDSEELVKLISRKMPRVTQMEDNEVQPPAYCEIRKREQWMMTEKHWRARWDLAKKFSDLAFLREQVPERLLIEFAQEDDRERMEQDEKRIIFDMEKSGNNQKQPKQEVTSENPW